MPTLAEVHRQIESLPARPYIFWTRKEIRALPEILAEGEVIKGLTSGMINGNTWLVVCTDTRLVFLNCGMVLGVQQIQMPLDRIQSIDHQFTILFGSLKVYDGVSYTTIGLILKSAILPFVKATQQAMHEFRQKLYGAKITPSNDVASQLEKLADLKERGHLTEEEFQAQKHKLLSS